MWGWPLPTQRKVKTKIWMLRVCGWGFFDFFKGKTSFSPFKLMILLDCVYNSAISQILCLCSKCSRVKTGKKGCVPEEACQNKKIWKSCMALNSDGCVFWSLLSYSCYCNSNGWTYLTEQAEGIFPNAALNDWNVCKSSWPVVYSR